MRRCRSTMPEGRAPRHRGDGTHARGEEGDIEDDAGRRASTPPLRSGPTLRWSPSPTGAARQLALPRWIGPRCHRGSGLLPCHRAVEVCARCLLRRDRPPEVARSSRSCATSCATTPDGVNKVIRALSYQRTKYPKRKRIGEVLRYFRHNRHRMRYAQAKARHLPIGSGVVEAACKSLVSQRLKCSGMRWRHDGGQAILTLRALVRSERFEPAWTMLSADLSSRGDCPRQHRRVSSQARRVTTQCQSYTPPRVDFGQIGDFEFSLPPRDEQSRIAATLDELFSDLDAGGRGPGAGAGQAGALSDRGPQGGGGRSADGRLACVPPAGGARERTAETHPRRASPPMGAGPTSTIRRKGQGAAQELEGEVQGAGRPRHHSSVGPARRMVLGLVGTGRILSERSGVSEQTLPRSRHEASSSGESACGRASALDEKEHPGTCPTVTWKQHQLLS